MDSATGEAYAAAEPDPVSPHADGAIAHLNADHADALVAMAQVLGGYPDATAATCTGADRYGLDLQGRHAARRGLHPDRLCRTHRLDRRIAFGHRRVDAPGAAGLKYHPDMSSIDRPDTWQAAFDLIRTRGYEHRAEPFKLASGQLSHDYIDGKFAVDTGERLAIVSRAVADLAAAHGIEFDAVGGLTMGADPLAHGVAMVTGKAWFSVRKEQKQRGREQWIEGTRLGDRHPRAARRRRDQHRRLHREGARARNGGWRGGHRRDPDGRPRRRRRQTLRRARRPVRRACHLRDLGIEPVKDV